MRKATVLGMLVCCALLGVSASDIGAQTRDADPNAIAKLQARQREKPTSASVVRALGIAYYKAGRIAEALATLEKARRLNPRDGTTALYTGLAAEQLGDLKQARESYSSYLVYGKTKRVRSQLQARLAALSRKELEQSAKIALANEARLASTPGEPRTIAVLPFRFSGTDTSLIPLERGIADLLVNDLSHAKSLTIVERERMQAIFDEIGLAQSGATEGATAVRAGKLIRAGRVVQGSLTQLPSSSLRIDAAVVDASTSQATGSASGDDRLDEIFSLEKKIALNLIDAMGVTLTAAERKAIEQRPTKSLAAFLAYSSGLMAEDAGNFGEARRFYQEAVRIDPAFRGAALRQQHVEQIVSAQATTPAQVELQIAGGAEEQVVAAAERGGVPGDEQIGSLGGTALTVAEFLNPSNGATAIGGSQSTGGAPVTGGSVSHSTGTNNPASQTGTIRITIPQQGTP